jgi:hypothetical protein
MPTMPTNNREEWRKYLVPESEPLLPRRHRGNLFSYGPDELRLREGIILLGGPEEFVRNNPQLFATGSTSSHEGYAYWALLKIIGPEAEPGSNGLTWFYQSKVSAGRDGDRLSIVDFLIEGTGNPMDLGIRIVTPWHHELQGAAVRAFDFEQVFRLLDQDIFVVDVRSVNYMNDRTGQDAIRVMNRAIQNRPDYNPYHRSTRG